MKKYYIMDGNEACARAAYMFSEVCGIYPITPASPMATLCDKWSSEGKKNIFNESVKVVEMQSEAGAAALVHGSLQAGSLSTTFTASQGLLLMLPSMYKMAGELLPGVIHVAARSIATHALSIFGDHQDVYAVRSAGFAMLSSANVQDAHYLAIVSHLASIKSRIPFLHFFDGFRTSHELNKINILTEKELYPFIDFDEIKKFKNNALNIGKAITRGTSQTEDIYFQNTEARNKYYEKVPEMVKSAMEDINRLAGTDYKPFNYYGSSKAENIIVAMGSVTDTIKSVVDKLNENGENVGVLIVRLFRPFSKDYFLKELPKTVKKIAVLDRSKEAGSIGEALYLDVCAALKEENITIIGGRYGLSSKNTSPSMIKSVFDNLNKFKMKEIFTIGIEDDITDLSLKESPFSLDSKYKEIKIFGFGSDGMVGGAKNILKVVGENDKNYVQGYFEYDSKKSGGVTIGHLRIASSQINAPYYPENSNLIVVTKDSYVKRFDVLNGIKEGGIFLLNTTLNDEEINKFLPNKIKEIIKNKNIKFFVTNSFLLSEKYNLGGKINNIISYYILHMLGMKEDGMKKYSDLIEKTYKNKGEEIVKSNLNALKEAFNYLREYNKNLFTFEEENDSLSNNIIDEMLKRRGEMLKVSDFIGHEDGTFEGNVSTSDRHKISEFVPKWKKENCIECNQCAFVCPHAVIRPFSLTEEDLNKYGITKEEALKSMAEKDKYFYISVSEENCTGCTLCIDACPGKGGEKALEVGEYDEEKNEISNKIFEHNNETIFPVSTIKGNGFVKPDFEFCGACAGCGESGYLKVLTSMFKDEIVISNATGCSSIYGGSLPNTPYKMPWINSLFEDNAEFGLGLYFSYKNNRERIKNIMFEKRNFVEKEVKDIFKKYVDNMENPKITREVKEELKNKEIPEELNELLDFIPSRKVWIIGGDGWAYDIGYGGLDHILHSDENVNILILDTEVYSNTGGQKSKSTRVGGIAEFSSTGKYTYKKDLFKIAMNIPNVYVASISMGANMNQTLRAFKEASEHNGPSVIIAYSTCISHGISGGMKNSLKEQKLLVDSGYNILMRYNPIDKKLSIDSKEPDFSKYENVFKKELRYKNLENLNSNDYKELYEKNIKFAEERWNYFKEIELKNQNI